MTVLLLDARWPTMIPMELAGAVSNPLHYTDEVPIKVRWNLSDLVSRDSAAGTLVSTDECDPEVQAAIAAGATVVEVPTRQDPIAQAQQVMARARQIGQWEAQQTHESLLPYLVEETAEFSEAVKKNADSEHLRDELSDIFLQVLFHAEIAEDFELADVATAFVEKMRVRAPYLFDASRTQMVPVAEQERLWQEGKRS
ncbi:XTP/dITP diphosphohydrolase [Corynebacterium spheniscorum]|uniref:XTP/dITP diphosphohydrolase n=2 Tax=Corynebacterium spheniscorum TaxID=185761 RepID=A0A1I2RYE5_9CORY|nr:MazG nucleotide pyrophosphohydrolase domain-containing protein [Corynebacterium spheniscorum]KAA8720938.1 nucleoside triphosphate hydrolase [Corynebacterium spheniscorum]SFG45715.1 XTP/dITP diphosphohydrolase [Corynebacterium spheniscorum]